jgi:dTMP kinase
LDGAGTTTQAARLADHLRAQGQSVLETCEPTDLTLGKVLRTALRGQWGENGVGELNPGSVALLFAADRLDHLTRRVKPALNEGTTVISDRYVYSSMAYQGSLLEPAWVSTINGLARKPDLTLYVRVSVETAMSRLTSRGSDREIYEKEAMLQSVYDGYEGLVARGEMANLGIDDVFQQIRAAVTALMSEA